MPEWLEAALKFSFDRDKHASLNFAVVSAAMLALIDSISSYLETYIMTSIGQWVAHDIRRKVYHHVERLSLCYYDQKQTGDMITRMTNDTEVLGTQNAESKA